MFLIIFIDFLFPATNVGSIVIMSNMFLLQKNWHMLHLLQKCNICFCLRNILAFKRDIMQPLPL